MARKAIYQGSYNDVRKIPSDGRAQIAFAGRSNVGKSSLLNRLVGQKRLAKTSKTPGRTRMINFFLVDETFYFVDLPGYGFARASRKEKNQWNLLVESYFQNRGNLRGLILLLDCRREPNEDDLMLLDWVKGENIDLSLVLTKADKLGRSNLANKIRTIEKALGIRPIPFSSISGIGKKELLKWIDEIVTG